MKPNFPLFFFFCLFWACESAPPVQEVELPVIPSPQEIRTKKGMLSLKNSFNISIDDEILNPLAKIVREDFYLLTGIKTGGNNGEKIPSLRLAIDATLAKESYELIIDDQIKIKGGSYAAVSMGTVTLFHLLTDAVEVPKLVIQDEPKAAYRSLMVDVARTWHDIAVLEELVILCKWYKINYLHLHLTDDQSITFPSQTYPFLATDGRQYSREDLEDLNEFAYKRGVVLVPEIDVPGHSSEFIKNMPKVFGIADLAANPYTINIGKETAYEALDKLIGEVAAVFTHSPYIHIGGDEAFFSGIDKDPEAIAYMEANNIPTVKELFRHFIVRMNEMIQAKGKQTIVWAGFSEKGAIEIPQDVIVMLWEPQYYKPEQLEKDGYKMINASFKPLYVVNNRKWSVDYIYEQWNPRRWESWANTGDFVGYELPNTDNILGGTMCAWEQSQWNELHRLRKRIPAMNAHLWQGKADDLAEFNKNLIQSDAKLSRLLQAFTLTVEGLQYPNWQAGNFNEHAWFDDKLTVQLTANYPDLTIRYALGKQRLDKNSRLYTKPLILDKTTMLQIAAFNEKGKMVGLPMLKKYFHQPLSIATAGLEKDLPPNSWEKHRFENEMTITMTSPYPDATIKYTLDDGKITKNAAVYKSPIPIQKTTHLHAQLFDKNRKKIGSPFRASYFLLKNRPSLTSNKPTTASNQNLRPDVADAATNGRVTLWEQWGDHTNGNNWIQVDLEKNEAVSEFKIYTFWDGHRYYQYTIEGSIDGENWTTLVDASENMEIATDEGQSHKIETTEVRYLKLNMLYNSANPGLHVVEFSAY